MLKVPMLIQAKRLFVLTQPARNKWCETQHQFLKALIPKLLATHAELDSVASAEDGMKFEAAQALADKVDQLAEEATEIKAVVSRILGKKARTQVPVCE